MDNKWITFKDEKPNEHAQLLVTNRIDSKDAHGKMSHIWLITFWTYSEEHGCFVTFSNNMMVHNLTHWRYALPEEER